MLSDMPRPKTDSTSRLLGEFQSFEAALSGGGDSRTTVDPRTGLNKYRCPNVPDPDLVCLSSCTASPIEERGYDQAAGAFMEFMNAPTPRQRANLISSLTEKIKARLLDYFKAGSLADIVLCSSGTDAILKTAMILDAERSPELTTAILPAASETGTGVPFAAACRAFDGQDTGKRLTDRTVTTVEIQLRCRDGSPRRDDEVNEDFAAAVAAAKGRVIVYLTHGTKTGLIGPRSPPAGVDVIVDACQARIDPETVIAYLSRGWPVVITGSKFFGGPAFSGAIMFPRARLASLSRVPFTGSAPTSPLQSPLENPAILGTALRWTAAMPMIDQFEPMIPMIPDRLADLTSLLRHGLESSSVFVPVGGLRPEGFNWASQPSIFTIAIRDPTVDGRFLSVAELRRLHERLSRRGVLVGQPVDLGSFGGLRIAIGARDLIDGVGANRVSHVFETLMQVAKH